MEPAARLPEDQPTPSTDAVDMAPVEPIPLPLTETLPADSAGEAPPSRRLRASRRRRDRRVTKRRRWLLYLRDFVLGVGVLAIFALAAGTYYLERFEIRSESMEPTLMVGDTLWAVRLMEPPVRGQLVAFPNPDGPQMLIKRVIALPGEMVEARDGIVFVNLGELNEAVWVDDPEPTADFDLVTLGPDEYFMMGDNRDRSTDSRVFGPIPLDSIEYRILVDD